LKRVHNVIVSVVYESKPRVPLMTPVVTILRTTDSLVTVDMKDEDVATVLSVAVVVTVLR